ncbi:MAG TPA: hypothetical protein PK425_05610 [Syntrophales bacterium]|nr:hypothetical protein [Syntrophales bacterium]HQA82527.1 hypothetical protein [Syntrophales bacterium]
MMRKRVLSCLAGGLLCLLPAWSYALSPEEVVKLKKAGVEEKTIRMMIAQEMEAANRNPYDSLGTREIRDRDGNTVVIYSTGRPAGSNLDREEQEKLDRAWEMLQNMVIEVK